MAKIKDPELRAMKRMIRDLETIPSYAAKLRVLEYLYTRLVETAEVPPAKPHLVPTVLEEMEERGLVRRTDAA